MKGLRKKQIGTLHANLILTSDSKKPGKTTEVHTVCTAVCQGIRRNIFPKSISYLRANIFIERICLFSF